VEAGRDPADEFGRDEVAVRGVDAGGHRFTAPEDAVGATAELHAWYGHQRRDEAAVRVADPRGVPDDVDPHDPSGGHILPRH
jgi:hypothetical protein